jgi:uncharacterized protein (DUF433 family)
MLSGTRAPVQTLIDSIEEGDSLDDFLLDFGMVRRADAASGSSRQKEEAC